MFGLCLCLFFSAILFSIEIFFLRTLSFSLMCGCWLLGEAPWELEQPDRAIVFCVWIWMGIELLGVGVWPWKVGTG
jgi:hypothetical protein